MADNPYAPSPLGGAPAAPLPPAYAPSQLGGAAPAATTGYLATLPTKPAAAPAPSAYKPSPIDIVIHTESGGRNVTQSLGTRDVNNNWGRGGGHPAQGYLQVIDPTYQAAARKMGIDINRYPSINMLPMDQQIAVASTIPFNQWGGASKRAVQAAYPNIDIRGKTLGQIQAEAGGAPIPSGGAPTTPGTTLNTPPPAAAVANALTGGTGASGQGLSPIQQLQKDIGGGDGGGQALPPAPAPQLGPGDMHNQQVAAQAPQLMSAWRQTAAQPLTWGSKPFGATAGPQDAPPTSVMAGGQYIPMPGGARMPGALGTTLNSTGLYG